MHFLTTAFGYFSAIILIFITLILVLIQGLLGNQKLFDPLIRLLCRILPAMFGIRVKTLGLEKLDPEKTYLFMANHVNIFDGFILYGYIPHFIRGVELEDHFSWPVWGTITRRMGNIPISHKNTVEALKSLDIAQTSLSMGTSIVILPEGHRTRDGKLQHFMRGPFMLAKNAEVDIIPIVMKGLWERKSVKSKIVRPGSVELVFGKPITSELTKQLSDKELKDKVRGILLDMLG
jgi:1-acyl-sn-glycerol-3-phosphate acyltransferase